MSTETFLNGYADLLRKRAAIAPMRGLQDIPALCPAMFPYQRAVTEYLLACGRGAAFLDTGLGKSLVSLDWGRVVAEHTGKPVLMLAPLAVAPQHVREAHKFGLEARIARDQSEVGPGVNVTNYAKVEHFDASAFGGVILDESSIIKNFTGATSRNLISLFSETPFRLACTATPAPNDHMELGQHSAFLGAMASNEMLSRWFIADQNNMGRYRLKGHAVKPFWNWVASWARCISKPSDLGYPDDGFILPKLNLHRHIVQSDISINTGETLFRIPEMSATSIHEEKRLTIVQRAKLAADIVFGDESACRGSPNTLIAAARNTPPTPPSANAASSNPDHQKKTQSTCAATTKRNRKNSVAAKSSKTSTTKGAELDTLPTAAIEKSASYPQNSEILQLSETVASDQHSESLPATTIELQPAKAEHARSAMLLPQTAVVTGSPSITAMQPETSAASCAPTVISPSENSKTTPHSYGKPPSTSSGRDWWVVWCDTDYEQDELERLFGDAAVSIRGSQSDDRKEELHEIWMRGERSVLICKPAMFGYGLNWQHCCNMVFVGLSFSYERFYQAIRRCWRFGQTREVQCHLVMADTERNIWDVVTRKSGDHETMKVEMYAAMRRAHETREVKIDYEATLPARLPSWIRERAA